TAGDAVVQRRRTAVGSVSSDLSFDHDRPQHLTAQRAFFSSRSITVESRSHPRNTESGQPISFGKNGNRSFRTAAVFHADGKRCRTFRIRRRKRFVPRSIQVVGALDRVAKARFGRCSSRTANGRREASMLGSLEPLSEDGPVRQILTLYR